MNEPAWFTALKETQVWKEANFGKIISRQKLASMGFVDITTIKARVCPEDILASTLTLQWRLADGFVEIGSPFIGEWTANLRDYHNRRTLRHVWSPAMLNGAVKYDNVTSAHMTWALIKPKALGPIPNFLLSAAPSQTTRKASIGNINFSKPSPLP